ncbi:MAG: DUF6603 domain-containing protein [Polyangiaceae bacterium]
MAQEDGTPWPASPVALPRRSAGDGSALTTTGTSWIGRARTGCHPTPLLDAPETPVILNAAFVAIAADPAANKLLDVLTALGLLVDGAPQLAADALAALLADGVGYLGPRLSAALTAPLYGHTPADGLAIGPLVLRLSAAGAEVAIAHPLVSGSVTISPQLVARGQARVEVGGATLVWRHDGSLSVTGSLEPWVRDLPLWPVAATAADLPRSVLFSTVVDALLGGLVPFVGGLPPLDALLGGRVANVPTGLSLRAPSIQQMLQSLSAALGHPSDQGLLLAPADLLVSASETTAGKLRLGLSTLNPFGGVLGLDVGLVLAGGLAVEPSVSISLEIPNPPGAAGDAWQDVAVRLSLDASGSIGVALEVGTTTVTFLPTFSGWESLLAGGVALLPRALDEITSHVPDSSVKTAVLGVAQAFDLHGPTFAAHTAEFQAIGSWSYDLGLRANILDAVANLLALTPLAAHISHTGGTATIGWTSPAFPAPVSGTMGVALDWTSDLPVFSLSSDLAIVLHPGATALERVALAIGFDAILTDSGHALASVGLDRPLGTAVNPRVEIGVELGSSPEPVLRLIPLGSTDDGPVVVALLPEPSATVDDALLPGALGFGVALPLVSALIERATGSTALWPGGPSVEDLVDASGLFDGSHALVEPPPDVATVLGNVASAMSVQIPIDSLSLTLGNLGPSRIGVAIGGSVPIPIDDVELEVLFGEPTSGGASAAKTEVTLFRKSGDTWTLSPGVSANHFGVGVKGARGRPLLDTDTVRIGGLSGYTFFDIEAADDGVDAEFRGVGLSIVDLGVSLATATGGSNPIASGIMQSAASGDSPPPQPAFGIAIEYARGEESEEGAEGDFELRLKLLGENERRVWIGVRASFGPLYIDQIGIEIDKVVDPAWVALLIDGGVTVSGFSAQVDDLAIRVPLQDIDRPSNWGVDLAGLGIAYNEGGLSILGGLVKREITGGVEYAGMLQLRVQNIGAVAVGAWAQQVDDQGELDSLFIFAAVFLTISFPPYFELQALGAGFGYNRALVVPDDMNAIPSFPLVRVLDDPSAVEQPMQLLESLRSGMPARRGTFWFAAGLRGALFTVVDVVAVLYVAIDRGFEIGLLGVGRLAQPKGSPIVSIELAVKVRYSSAEGLLSIQAQLTDNSWLLMRDCQLTGGFALFVWFTTGKFVLTIGGYHPAFEPEPEFPVVPRLGFRCDVFGAIVIKGESYFALTNSCVMAGVRLEAAYDIGWLKAWFRAWADFLLSWDPFHYDISIGVELGVDFNIVIDLLFGKIRIHFSFSIGASLRIVGPPLHGELTAHLGPISLTVPFGNDKPPKPPLLTWQQFRDRYIYADDPAAIPVGVQADEGMVPPPSGDDPPQGLTASDPIRLVPEFSFVTTSSMPASEARDPLDVALATPGVAEIDLAPMGEIDVDATHRLRIRKANGGSVTLDPDRFETKITMGDFAEAVWRYRDHPEAATDNIRAVAGMRVTGRSEAINRSAQVPILTLVDIGRAHPLPFAGHDAGWRAETVEVGRVARDYGRRWTIEDAVALRSEASPGRPSFTRSKRASTEGTAIRAMRRRRSPPLAAALSEGMDLGPPGRGVAPAKEPVVRPARPVRRLHLEQSLVLASAVEVSAPRTTVSDAPSLLRMAPPRRSAEGRALGELVVMPTGLPATKAALRAKVLPRGKEARRRVAAVVAQATEHGITLPAGACQRWQIPEGSFHVEIRGDAHRVVALGRGGLPVLDVEGVGLHSIDLPKGTEQLVVWSLGRVSSKARGFGAISMDFGSGAGAAVGWHVESRLHVVGNLGALGRGCRVRLSVPLLRRRKTVGLAPPEMQRAATLLEEQSTLQTTLPAVSALLVAGSVVAQGADLDDDLAIGVRGAVLGEPLVFDAPWGQAALYPVEATAPFAVTVSSLDAVRLDGVLGLMGRPVELAARLDETSLASLVPDGPLCLAGAITLRLKESTS